eukprot:Phypoly_transcript_05281.p1 GENE.Phypoly_transcript_05281~~Phypoly_transcript_05281.p1  ORF type:complete len:542 (+),score=157.70 Phypoly_transcript_05281:206-1831(+)
MRKTRHTMRGRGPVRVRTMAGNGVVNGAPGVSRDQVKRAAEALKDYTTKLDPLEVDSDAAIYLGATLSQVSIKLRTKPKFFKVPHPVYPPASKVCLIIKDFDEEDKASKAIYSELKLSLDKVILYSKLKLKYKNYDTLRQLASRFDIFFVDHRLIVATSSLLGRQFAKKAHKPIPVKIENRTPQRIIQKIQEIKQSVVYLPANGPATSIKVGTAGFSAKQIAENTMAAIEFVQSKLGWSNVKHLYIRTPSSPSLTIFHVLPEITPGIIAEERAEYKRKKKEQKNPILPPNPNKNARKKKKEEGKNQGGEEKGEDGEEKPKAKKSRTEEAGGKKVEENKAKKGDKTPKKAENTPKKTENTPKKTENTPKKAENTPKKAESTPKKAENTPKKAEKAENAKVTESTPNGSDKKRKADTIETPKATKVSTPAPQKEEASTKKAKTDATPKKVSTPQKEPILLPIPSFLPSTPQKEPESAKKTKTDKSESAKKPKIDTPPTTPKATKVTTPTPQKESTKKANTESTATPTPKKTTPGSTKKSRTGK